VGVIRAGLSGFVYVSPTRYTDVEAVAQELAIVGKVPGSGIQMATDLLPTPEEVRLVARIVDVLTGEEICSGGGTEILIRGNVTLPLSLFEL
jgi:hypothetical protein